MPGGDGQRWALLHPHERVTIVTSERAPHGAMHVATCVNNNTYFTNSDSLGSARVQTDSSGALAATCQNLPYGQQTSCSDVSPLGFTGKQYDSETGLNDFGARYYASSLGRFMTPDWSATAEPVPYAKLDNPQTLNLYIYATDNPTTLTDPTGHMAPGSSGPLSVTGPFTDGEIPWPFTMPWDYSAILNPAVVLRNPKVSQKAVNDAKKAQKKNRPKLTLKQKMSLAVQSWAAATGSPLALALTRYMSRAEADTARSQGAIPNTDAANLPRPTHFTRDEPTNDAAEAKTKYELDQTPEFRATVPDERAQNLRVPESGPTTSGGGSHVVTDEPVPVFPEEISPMEMPDIPIDPFIPF